MLPDGAFTFIADFKWPMDAELKYRIREIVWCRACWAIPFQAAGGEWLHLFRGSYPILWYSKCPPPYDLQLLVTNTQCNSNLCWNRQDDSDCAESNISVGTAAMLLWEIETFSLPQCRAAAAPVGLPRWDQISGSNQMEVASSCSTLAGNWGMDPA